jgi:hypothetical protein
MTIRAQITIVATAVACVLSSGSVPQVDAAPYPATTCASRKQTEAGKYCERVLKAWSKWETRRSNRKRDKTLRKAAAKLEAAWQKADQEALAAGTNCTETTLSHTDARLLLDAGAADVVAAVNGGLNLRRRAQARCGAKLLKAAAKQCGALLAAEGAFISDLAAAGGGEERIEAEARADQKFARTWAKQTRKKSCSPGAALADLEGAIDDIRSTLVMGTIVSPSVDDQQFTTISPTGSTTYLGRELTPTCMDGSPYHYFVKRGSVNKVLMYYQGGGACWDALTCAIPVCDDGVDPENDDNPNLVRTGFADLTNPANPFRDWNVVFVSYCSCDVHFGDAAQDYSPTLHVEHRGYHNARVAEKWAREHFLNPEVVFVTGSSAGAYGAWFNAPLLHEVWPASQFHVLADAGNGVITQDFLERFFPNWDFEANLPPDIPELAQVLAEGSGIVGYTEVIAREFPATNWAHYTTAFDGGSGGQTGFYNIMLNDNDTLAALTWWNGSCAFRDAMRAQAIETAMRIPANYRYYIGTGSRHTMWGSNKVYTDTTGGVPTIASWIDAMLASTPASSDPAYANVECTNCGLLLPGDVRPDPLRPPFEQVNGDVVIDCGP